MFFEAPPNTVAGGRIRAVSLIKNVELTTGRCGHFSAQLPPWDGR